MRRKREEKGKKETKTSQKKVIKCVRNALISKSLVIRRIINATTAQEDEWLRNNIFHTRCTSHGKICDVIIDNDSCEHVVVAMMVEKLTLPTKSHPHPYKLAWLKKGNDVKVTKRCLIDFSIGKKYQDQVWCDVIPMDACHLLLGRPWQYDRNAILDCLKNTYSFEKDGVKIILAQFEKVFVNQTKSR